MKERMDENERTVLLQTDERETKIEPSRSRFQGISAMTVKTAPGSKRYSSCVAMGRREAKAGNVMARGNQRFRCRTWSSFNALSCSYSSCYALQSIHAKFRVYIIFWLSFYLTCFPYPPPFFFPDRCIINSNSSGCIPWVETKWQSARQQPAYTPAATSVATGAVVVLAASHLFLSSDFQVSPRALCTRITPPQGPSRPFIVFRAVCASSTLAKSTKR